MGLFKPIWMKSDDFGTKNRDKALAAVAKMTDQAKLAQVVRDAVRGEVALAAAEKLDDKSVLMERLEKNFVCDIGTRRQMYTMCMESGDQSWSKNFAMSYELSYVNAELRHALDGIRSQADFIDIAKNAKNLYVRRAAIERVTNPRIRGELNAELTPLEEERDKAAAEANRQAKAENDLLQAKRAQSKKWREEGRCPHCGVRLAWLSAPQGPGRLYCSNCKNPID